MNGARYNAFMDIFPLLGFIDLKTLLLVFHLFGVALGAGGAIFSAVIFTKVMHDGKVTKNELDFIELASLLVSIGLGLLILSGISLFLTNPEGYLESTKFLAKMTIIGVLVVNGVLIHSLHVPVLRQHINDFLPDVTHFKRRSMYMYAGGAISMTSWGAALVLGVFRSVPYSYETIMLIYGVVLVLAIVTALALRKFTFAQLK